MHTLRMLNEQTALKASFDGKRLSEISPFLIEAHKLNRKFTTIDLSEEYVEAARAEGFQVGIGAESWNVDAGLLRRIQHCHSLARLYRFSINGQR